jgi:hypothetical protein
MTNWQMKECRISTIYKSELFIMAEPPNLVNYLLPDKGFFTHAHKRAYEVFSIVGKKDSHPEGKAISVLKDINSPVFVGGVITPSKRDFGNLASQVCSVAQLWRYARTIFNQIVVQLRIRMG